MRKETKYNKLVGRIGDEYYFLDYTFKHSDDFIGATGSVLRPISRDEYDDRTSAENIRDIYKEIWQELVASGNVEESLDDWLEQIEPDEMFDQSYWELGQQLREKLNLNKDDYPIIECTGGGRCFSKDMEFDEVYDKKLIKIINKYEK